VVRFEGGFNYSSINNFAVSRTDGEHILLLNDDTEVISGEWLSAMLEQSQRPEVGAVGAKLLYPDGRIQHAGVVMEVGNPWTPGRAGHAYKLYDADSPSHLGTLQATCNYSAVTGACMMLRREVFEEVGGFDEENFAVAFNDVDLCLRIRERGYFIVYTPHAKLYHHESASRGLYSDRPEEPRHMRERWGGTLDNDPYYNSNFSLAGDFNLRADLMRPRVLREQNGEAPGGILMHPEFLGEEEFRSYVEGRRREARSSRRVGLV
jgi:GT2 family glycosyltransferase